MSSRDDRGDLQFCPFTVFGSSALLLPDHEVTLYVRRLSTGGLEKPIMTGVVRSAFISLALLDILDNSCHVITSCQLKEIHGTTSFFTLET